MSYDQSNLLNFQIKFIARNFSSSLGLSRRGSRRKLFFMFARSEMGPKLESQRRAVGFQWDEISFQLLSRVFERLKRRREIWMSSIFYDEERLFNRFSSPFKLLTPSIYGTINKQLPLNALWKFMKNESANVAAIFWELGFLLRIKRYGFQIFDQQ